MNYEGSTDTEMFETFIETLLPYCGRWPEPRSLDHGQCLVSLLGQDRSDAGGGRGGAAASVTVLARRVSDRAVFWRT